ncbi:MAG TPA: hypothetical protein VMU95_39845 [Trebonia sp.]|nr:hypothetical protein [Trebonia sp.]
MIALLMPVFRRYIAHCTATARADVMRNVGTWCDYGAHRGFEYTVDINGRQMGQSCWRHYGALMRDFSEPRIEFKTPR